MKPAFRVSAIVFLGLIVLTSLFLSGCSNSEATEEVARPDMINIGDSAVFDMPERAPVWFAHDLHTEALTAQNKDCTFCHPVQDNNHLSQKFMRVEDTDKQEVMELYHDKCIACHNQNAAEGIKTGPVTCGECHQREPEYVSSRQPFGFDKSLHFRHVQANDDKCENCHHVYDESSKKLVYAKDQESTCRDCHRAQTKDNVPSLRLAVHTSCIKCHHETAVNRPQDPTGPQTCGGCHDEQHQTAIAVVENPPRLMRNQPDFVILSAPDADLEDSKLNTVPFSHVLHEQKTDNCRVCHHETLSKCSECHTMHGDEKGGGVMLQDAMHNKAADHSCVGCHEREKSTTGCAGCHDLLAQHQLSQSSCERCHAGPDPQSPKSDWSRFTSLDDFRPDPSESRLSYDIDEIPETVTIGSLSDKYEPAVMPHRKIVNKLSDHIKNSGMATRFHGHEDVVCQACHHNGSIGKRPALCGNCHGKPFDEHNIFKPGLYGAYHRQCLGCHLSMDLQKPSDCVLCHEKKETPPQTHGVNTGGDN